MKKINIRFLTGTMILCGIMLLVVSCEKKKGDKTKGRITASQETVKEKTEIKKVPILDDKAVIAFWEFKDAKNPGKDSSNAGNNLIIKGSTTLKDGVMTLNGGSYKEAMKKQDYIYSTSKEFEMGNDSFSVECWFKSPKIVYDKLVGTRISIRPQYTELKGWALGLSKAKGAIIFVVNDNKNQSSFAQVNVANSSWDEDVLNYIVGVRDRKTKKLKLYLNGVLVNTVDDKTGNLNSGENLKIGIDQYGGTLTEGTLLNLKIEKSVITEKEIANEYAKSAKVEKVKKSIVLKDNTPIPTDLKIDNTDGLNGKLNLQPQPINIKYSQKYVALKTPVYIQLPAKPTEQQRVAKKVLISDFKSHLKIDLKELEAGKKIDSGTIINLSGAKEKSRSESYRLNIVNSEKVTKITLSSPDHGILYGAFTVMQIVEQTTLIKNGKVSIPNKIKIYDYPIIPRRIQVRLLSTTLTDTDSAIHRIMLRIARTRMNFYNVNPMAPSLENIARLIKISKMYGIEMLATIGYTGCCRDMKRSLTPADMKPFLKRYADVAKVGCKGISFQFDDLAGYTKVAANHPGGVGAFQREFLVEIQKVAKNNGISFFSTCPTMYMRNWQTGANAWFGAPSKYPDYFKLISQLPKGDIEVFYTDISGIPELEKLGVTRPAYYLNGVWGSKQMLGVYAGPNRLTWSWYGFEVDPIKGPTLVPKTMTAWRNIAKMKVKSVWIGNGSFEGSMIAGIWLWNPEVFNEKEALKEINRNIGLGGGTFDTLLAYEKNILPLIALFKTYINGWTTEFQLKTLKRKHKLNREDLKTYWNNYQQAEIAYKSIKAIIAKENKVYRPRATSKIINEMEKTLKLFKKKLIRKLTRKGIVIN